MGFFDKIKQGLSKTREALSRTLDSVFSGHTELDDDFYDELEMVLISADVGVKTTEKIIEKLKAEVRARREGNPEHVRGILKEIVAGMMDSEPFNPRRPSVVLVVGVNGVGRTFKMAKYSAVATNAFSPPLSSVMVLTCFPGGCTRISMPQVKGFSGSSRISWPLPPPNISSKVWPK